MDQEKGPAHHLPFSFTRPTYGLEGRYLMLKYKARTRRPANKARLAERKTAAF